MSFRQHNKDPDLMWRKRMRSQLIAAGLPNSVVDDERRWNYVLLHGADEFQSGWSPQWITQKQAADLLALIGDRYQSEGLDLIRELRNRASDS